MAGQQKAVHDAQANVDAAKRQLLVIRKRVEVTFETKPDFKAAKEAMDKAKAEYDAEVRKIAFNLEKSPDYVALVKKRDTAQALLDKSRNPANTDSGADPVKITDEEITAAVKDHGDAALAMLAAQKQAEEADPNIPVLKQKRADAQAAWDALELQVDEALKADPQYPPAQQAVDSAEQSLAQAKEQLAAASKAQRDAEAAAARNKASTIGRH
jgi:hypothetical protein